MAKILNKIGKNQILLSTEFWVDQIISKSQNIEIDQNSRDGVFLLGQIGQISSLTNQFKKIWSNL